ncbi:MAG TPA: hypothetical protein ENJ33_00405 [Thiothrix sp.]|nr:hypothetical protein [Thiothrix sp.]
MFYFVIQTLFLSLLIFTMGLFVGIFLKHLLCKQQLQRIKVAHDRLKAKGQRHISRRRAKYEEVEEANVHSVLSVSVKPSESAALAKKRTTALVKGRRRAAREAVSTL